MAAIAFGANLGNAKQTYKECIRRINALPETSVVRYSSLILTDPVGGPADQPKYHNGAILVQTRLEPEELLNQTQKIELTSGAFGRLKTDRAPAISTFSCTTTSL